MKEEGRSKMTPHVYQIANGNWKHLRSNVEFSDASSAAMDYRFCGEWSR